MAKLEETLGYKFVDRAYIEEALTHSTYSHEKLLTYSNERLEFLGDSVLHLILTDYIIRTYPNASEGKLSALRSYCENEDFLALIATELSIGDYMLFGRGETVGGGSRKNSLLANAFEAVLGAIYMDGGYEPVKTFVLSRFTAGIKQAHDLLLYADPKSELQKYTQKHSKLLPVYTKIKEEGLEHEKMFTVLLEFDDKDGAARSFEGTGRNIKAAQKDAAGKALQEITDIKR